MAHKKNNNIINSRSIDLIRKILFVALLVVIFYSPYVRGLYFEREMLPTQIIVFLIFSAFWLMKLFKRDNSFLKTPIDYAALLYIIVYFISIFAAVNLRAAVFEWLKYCMYFAVFLMITELTISLMNKRIVLWTIVGSAVGVSIIGLDGASGSVITNFLNSLFNSLGAGQKFFFDTYMGGRIYSTLQYPNALASYLLAVYFLAMTLCITSKEFVGKIIAACMAFLILLTAVFTFSRGAAIVAVGGILLYILAQSGKYILKSIFALLSTGIPAAIIAFMSFNYVQNSTGASGVLWVYILAGIILTTLLLPALMWLNGKVERINKKWLIATPSLIIVIITSILLIIVYYPAPLMLDNLQSATDSNIEIDRKVVLDPGQYTLKYEVESENIMDKPYSYSLYIISCSEKDILFGGSTSLGSYQLNNGTKGIEEKKISFTVPKDSKLITFEFVNSYQGTKAAFYKASIYDMKNGSKVKNIALKRRFLPESINSLFEGLKANNSTISRSVFYKDALKIFSDNKIIGAGGGSWEVLYRAYRSYSYISGQAHNYLLQVLIETGIVGAVALSLLIIVLIVMFIRAYLTKDEAMQEHKPYYAGLITAAAVLFAHSFIDFDFSLGAIFLLFWTVIGMMNSSYINMNNEISNGNTLFLAIKKLTAAKEVRVPPAIIIAITIVFVILPVSLKLSLNYIRSSTIALSTGRTEEAINLMHNAAIFDPFKANIKIDLANIIKAEKHISLSDVLKADKEIEKAKKLSRYNYKYLPYIAKYYLQAANIDEGLKAIDRAVELDPFTPERWQEKINFYYQTVIYQFQKNNSDGAIKYLEKALLIPGQLSRANEKNLNPIKLNDVSYQLLERLKYIQSNMSSGGTINIDKLVYYYYPGLDVDNDHKPDQVMTQQPDTTIDENKDGIAVSKKEKGTINIYTRTFTLLPGKEYYVVIQTKNKNQNNTLRYYIEGLHNNYIPFSGGGDVSFSAFTTPDKTEGIQYKLFLESDSAINYRSIVIQEK